MMFGSFRARKMNGPVPKGGLIGRGVIEGVLDHGPLVEPRGGKAFAGPILVKECHRLERRFAINGFKLGEYRLADALLVCALHRRNADKAGQPVGAPAVVGPVMDLAQRAALAKSLA